MTYTLSGREVLKPFSLNEDWTEDGIGQTEHPPAPSTSDLWPCWRQTETYLLGRHYSQDFKKDYVMRKSEEDFTLKGPIFLLGQRCIGTCLQWERSSILWSHNFQCSLLSICGNWNRWYSHLLLQKLIIRFKIVLYLVDADPIMQLSMWFFWK